MGVCSGLAQCFLVIFNSIFVIAGMVATLRGIYLRLAANEYRKEHPVLAAIVPLDKYIRDVSMKFIIPGCIMIFVSCSGCCGAAKNKRHLLALYCTCMIILTAANIYNISSLKSESLSLFSYLKNNVFVNEVELEIFGGGNIYPELGLQILALLTAVYLLYSIGEKKKAANTLRFTNTRIQSNSNSS